MNPRELPHPLTPEIQALEQYESKLFQPANPPLCEYTPNYLIDSLIFKWIGGPKCHQLVGSLPFFFGNNWDLSADVSAKLINPNYGKHILFKSIGLTAGVVLGQPYQGLIVAMPKQPAIAKKKVSVNRVWNDYSFKHHLGVSATLLDDAPKLTASMIESYNEKVIFLAGQFTWASQAFLYLLETQLGIHIPETDFAVTRGASSKHRV